MPTPRCSSRCAGRSTSGPRPSGSVLLDTEPKHLSALADFARRAYRRPLTDAETQELRSLYGTLREEGLPHDEAVRLLVARLLVAPAFLYRIEKPVPGAEQGPVSNWEQASRLSYFLWSSLPDAELDAGRGGRQADRPRHAGRADSAHAPRSKNPAVGHRVCLPVAAYPRFRSPG